MTATYDEARTLVDVTSQADAGWVSELAAGGQVTLTVENTYLLDGTTRDAAQARCETLARLFGPAAVGQVRITEPSDATVTFNANFKVAPFSGGAQEAAKWSCEIKSSGTVSFD
jgi:predicted secreted protein